MLLVIVFLFGGEAILEEVRDVMPPGTPRGPSHTPQQMNLAGSLMLLLRPPTSLHPPPTFYPGERHPRWKVKKEFTSIPSSH